MRLGPACWSRRQRKHAEMIDAAGAFFIFSVGGNQAELYNAADTLP